VLLPRDEGAAARERPGWRALPRVGFPKDVTVTANKVPHAVVQATVADDPVTKFLAAEVRDWEYRS
jgi:hypothetical protein